MFGVQAASLILRAARQLPCILPGNSNRAYNCLARPYSCSCHRHCTCPYFHCSSSPAAALRQQRINHNNATLNGAGESSRREHLHPEGAIVFKRLVRGHAAVAYVLIWLQKKERESWPVCSLGSTLITRFLKPN